MLLAKLFLVIFTLREGYCDWVSEWMDPVQGELSFDQGRPKNNKDYREIDEDDSKLLVARDSPVVAVASPSVNYNVDEDAFSFKQMKSNLEKTLEDAKSLVAVLKTQIDLVSARETLLKDAIINGRSGVTALTVSTVGHLPAGYIIKDGSWFLCNGVIHYPSEHTSSLFGSTFTTPRCIGQEVLTSKDPCAFNSIIKYETTPMQRSSEYYEDDFYCLKSSFNSTMEQYLSVPRSIVNVTCTNDFIDWQKCVPVPQFESKVMVSQMCLFRYYLLCFQQLCVRKIYEGIVRSLKENIRQCGIRMLSEYSYYPQRESSSALPMEYCTGAFGACNLLVAWHITNASLENFEFLKSEPNFKRFFISSSGEYERLM